jgi:hypothetical protein
MADKQIVPTSRAPAFSATGKKLSPKRDGRGSWSLGALIRGVSAPRNLIGRLSRRRRRAWRLGRLPSPRHRSRCSHRCEFPHGCRRALCCGMGEAAASKSGKPAGGHCARRPAASGPVMPTYSTSNALRGLLSDDLSHARLSPSYSIRRPARFQTRERNSNACLRRKQGISSRFPLSLRIFNSGN